MVFLGDGEFDGTALQDTLSAVGWSSVCRTALSTTATWEGESFRLDVLGACLQPGRLIALPEVYVTREAYGPIMVRCCWAKEYQEPVYLVSNLATAEEACRWYQKRFRIEVDNFYVKQHVGLADLRVQSYAATAKWFAMVVVALAFLPWRLHHAQAEERWRAVADVVRHHRNAHARTLVEMAGQEAAKWTD